MRRGGVLEAVLRRDRWIVLAAVIAVGALAWSYTLWSAGTMQDHGSMAMPPGSWTATHAALVFVMWWVMMTAMMVPGAAPMVLLFAALARARGDGRAPAGLTAIFLAGYLLAWGGFSLLATAAQGALEASGLLSATLSTTSAPLGGALLVAAGLYQFTPVKRACLRYCRDPVRFLTRHWREHRRGALAMGWRHGAYCLGCCWFLMALLFVGGVMNVLWIGGLALYVGLEKLSPRARWLRRAAGAALGAAGALVLVGSL
jgi:predicted metal-binding membrane protein